MGIKEFKKKTRELKQRIDKTLKEIGIYFRREEARESAKHYIKGLLSQIDRKNSWQIAEGEGLKAPYKIQHLLDRSNWDSEELRNYNMQMVGETVGFEGGTLIVDETGFLKQGKKSAGVIRQYSGTAGRIENCQIGVFLGYLSGKKRVLIDRELYIPKEWSEDKKRCICAGIPEDRSFSTKLELAQDMIKRALNQGYRPLWVVADEVYGQSYPFRKFLEANELSYVVAVPKSQSICWGLNKEPAYSVLSELTEREWRTLSCGDGSKRDRLYKWVSFPLNSPKEGYKRYLLLRKNLNDSDNIAYYFVSALEGTTLQEMVKAAGHRWAIEECFKSAKGEVGLDQYEVRSYKGWYRHITLSMLAYALLVVTQAQLFVDRGPKVIMTAFKKKRGLL